MHTVLLVEDERPVSHLLAEMLTRFGYRVQIASAGREGLSFFDNGSFDLVITDIAMPDLDGHQVARYIRKSSRPNTPIIGISGTPLLLRGDHFNCVLTKPFPLKSLIGAVEDLVSPPATPRAVSQASHVGA